jgi:hypothetical protein
MRRLDGDRIRQQNAATASHAHLVPNVYRRRYTLTPISVAARTLGSSVRVPLQALMFVCVMFSCAGLGFLTRRPLSTKCYQSSKKIRKSGRKILQKGHGSWGATTPVHKYTDYTYCSTKNCVLIALIQKLHQQKINIIATEVCKVGSNLQNV